MPTRHLRIAILAACPSRRLQVVVAIAGQQLLQRQLRLLIQPRQLIRLLALQCSRGAARAAGGREAGGGWKLANVPAAVVQLQQPTPAAMGRGGGRQAQQPPPHLDVAPLCHRQLLLFFNSGLVVGIIVLPTAVLLCSSSKVQADRVDGV